MKFGISFLPDASPKTKSARSYFEDALALSQMADEGEMASVKITEHYLHPYGGYCPSPLAFLSAVAARTRSVRLMTGCILPAFHHPLQIAAETAMVDAISGGRLEVGFARAYLPYEFRSFGVPIDESRERFEATVGAVIDLWTKTSVSAKTNFFEYTKATSLPRPIQRPHPPVWVAAVQTRESFEWIGRQGFGLLITASMREHAFLKEVIALYRSSFAAAHAGTGKTSKVMISLPLYIADTNEQAVSEGDRFLARYFAVWASAADAWTNMRSPAYQGYSGMALAIRRNTPETMRAEGNALIGSVDHVLERTQEMVEKLGLDEISWVTDFGSMPIEASRRSLGTFIERVLPRLGATAAPEVVPRSA